MQPTRRGYILMVAAVGAVGAGCATTSNPGPREPSSSLIIESGSVETIAGTPTHDAIIWEDGGVLEIETDSGLNIDTL